jgi:hypothetical protein
VRRLLLTLTGLVLAGCGNATVAPGSDPPPEPLASYRPDQVVVQAAVSGGFTPPGESFRIPAYVTVYGDGRVVRTGPVPEIHPGPALVPLEVGWIRPEVLRDLLRAAVTDGVDGGVRDYGEPAITDQPTTTVTIRVRPDAAPVTVSAYALAAGTDGTLGLSSAQKAARARLLGFLGRLDRLPVTGVRPLPPAVVAGLVVPAVSTPDPYSTLRPWPGPALSADSGQRCVVLSDPAAVRGVVTATRVTRWSWRGRTYDLVFRPLLPHERGCPDR